MWELNISEKINEKNTAAAIPPAVAVSPPVNKPITPLVETCLITPFASVLPKPTIGTVAPAFPKSTMGSYNPKPSKKMPATKKVTKILADVILVLIIKICPIKQIIPPTKKTLRYVNNMRFSFLHSTLNVPIFLTFLCFPAFNYNCMRNGRNGVALESGCGA